MQIVSNILSHTPPHLLNNIGKPPHKQAHKLINVDKQRTFVWPIINTECYAATMERYRERIAAYNEQIPAINKGIREFNNAVELHAKENPIGDKIALVDLFTEKYHTYKLNEYNQEVEAFNARHGMYITKRLRKKVKVASESVFSAILYDYKLRINKKTTDFQNTGNQMSTSLLKCEVHAHNIAYRKRNGYRNLEFCPKTIRNHRDRLEEAGVLELRAYRGTSRPVEFFISKDILVVIDLFKAISQKSKNQSLSSQQRKKAPDNNVYTSPSKKNYKKKGNVHFLNAEDATHLDNNLDHSDVEYKSTGQLQAGIPLDKDHSAAKNAPAAENLLQNTANTPTSIDTGSMSAAATYLRALKSRYDLAKELHQGQYDNYIRIPARDLVPITKIPGIKASEIREIFIQDFIKSSARLWKDNHAYIGSWYQAITFIYEGPGLFTFNGGPLLPDAYLKWIKEMRYRLDYAARWFIKRDWKGVSYPNLYFDPIRKNPDQICFAYTRKVWTKKLNKIADQATKKAKRLQKQRVEDEALRLTRKEKRQLDNAINKYLNRTYDANDFYTYCERNIKKLDAIEIKAYFDKKLEKRYSNKN